MTSLPIAQLVEDFSVYPRHAVDDANVSALVNALRAGAALPPIVIEKTSRRIVDGWHRARAYRRVLGPEGVVDVLETEYESEAALLLDSIERNASHGRKLDTIDLVRAIHMCQERGVPLGAVALVLHLPLEKVGRLSVRLAAAPQVSAGTVPGTLQVALKRPVAHLSGTELTAEQVVAHGRAPGVSYLLIAQQLREALAVGFINAADRRLTAALRSLRDALNRFFERD